MNTSETIRVYFDALDYRSVCEFQEAVYLIGQVPLLLIAHNEESLQVLKLWGVKSRDIPVRPFGKSCGVMDCLREALAECLPGVWRITERDEVTLQIGLEYKLDRHGNHIGPEYQPALRAVAVACCKPEIYDTGDWIEHCAARCGSSVPRRGNICPRCSRERQRRHHFHQPKWRKSGGRK